MKFKNVNKLILSSIMVGVILISSSCSLLPTEESLEEAKLAEPKDIVFNTLSVEKGDITNNVTVVLEVMPTIKYDLRFPKRGGYLSEINFKQNDKVKKGDIIAAYDSSDVKIQIKQQELSLESAKLDLDNALIEYNKAKKNKDKSLINIASIAYKKQEIAYQKEVLNLEQLNYVLENSIIKAPISGTIITMTEKLFGDYVNAQENICTIADSNEIYLKCQADKIDFALGDKVEFLFREKDIYKGIVKYTPNNPIDSESSSLTNVYLIEPTKFDRNYIVNETFSCEVVKSKVKNVVTVPKNFVVLIDGKYYVYIVENNVRTQRQVKIGINDGTSYEIKDGLSVGEQVLIR